MSFSLSLILTESTKNMKRGRVPKGFLSSNTAYMLVYKKLTIEQKLGNGKKLKTKKTDSECNSCSDSVSLERLTVKDRSDSSDEGKRKNGTDDFKDIESPGKMMKIEADCKMEVDGVVTGKNYNSDAVKDDKSSTEQPKKIVTKNTKLDYKLLNGAAHRAMSCGERDFYEEVCICDFSIFSTNTSYVCLTMLQIEFENWQVSNTMRELVRQENVKHELSLLAIQQEKVSKKNNSLVLSSNLRNFF